MPRRVEPADADAVAELLNAYTRALHGEDEVTAAEVASWWQDPDVEAWLDDDAYADLSTQTPERLWIDLRGAPSRPLLEAAEARARELAPPEALLRTVVDAEDAELRRLLEGAGYAHVRSSYRMRIELAEAPAPPAWPNGITARAGTAADARRAYDAYVEAFTDHWDFHAESFEDWQRWNVERPGSDPGLWVLGEQGSDLAGAVIARPHGSGAPDAGFVSILAVRRPWRGLGLGLALLQAAFAELYRRGRRIVELGVDTENDTGAVRLYERAGMHVARRSDTLEKPLRHAGL